MWYLWQARLEELQCRTLVFWSQAMLSVAEIYMKQILIVY